MTPDAANKHLFYTEMAKLLEAGFDIRKAAGVMADTRLPAAQMKLLETLNTGLEAGETIAGAFSRDAKAVGKLEKSMIAAGRGVASWRWPSGTSRNTSGWLRRHSGRRSRG